MSAAAQAVQKIADEEKVKARRAKKAKAERARRARKKAGRAARASDAAPVERRQRERRKAPDGPALAPVHEVAAADLVVTAVRADDRNRYVNVEYATGHVIRLFPVVEKKHVRAVRDLVIETISRRIATS